MASSSLSVYGANNKWLRTYGGNRSDVKLLKRRYEHMNLEQFLQQHGLATIEDYEKMRLSTNFNKS